MQAMQDYLMVLLTQRLLNLVQQTSLLEQTHLQMVSLVHFKELLMEGITSQEEVDCYLGDDECDHEGYVMTNKFGTFKLINRRQFSYANFTMKKEGWDK